MLETKIRTEKLQGSDRIGFLIWQQISIGPAVVEKMEFIEKPDDWETEPTGDLCAEEAQALMDSLWECGIRPSAMAKITEKDPCDE